MEHATQRANQILQTGKEALESAGNMKRECKAIATDSIQQLYEIVLALSDSRSRHMVSLEQERRRSAKELVRIERLHHRQIAELHKNHTGKLDELLSTQSQAVKLSESIWSWLNFELDGPLKSIASFEKKLQDIQETLSETRKRVPLSDDQGAVMVELRALSDKIVTLREDTLIVQASLSTLQRGIQEQPRTKPVTPIKVPSSDQTKTKPQLQIEPLLEEIRTLRLGVERLERTQVQRTEIQQDLAEVLKPLKAQLRTVVDEIRETKQDIIITDQQQGATSVIGSELAWEEVKGRLNEVESTVRQTALSISKRMEAAITNRTTAPCPEEKTVGQPGLATKQPIARTITLPSTYAQIAAKPRYSMVLESADPRKTGDDIIEDVKTLNVIDLGVGIHKVAKIKNHRVVVSCNSVEGRDTLKKAIEGKCAQISAIQSREKLPLIKLKGVLNDLTNTEIEKAITSQNHFLTDLNQQDKNVRVIRRAKARTRELCNPILEVSTAAWNRLVGKKLHVGLQCVWADDQSPVVQCYRCMSFNHRASDCKGQERCGYCAQAHDTRSCTQREGSPECSNCRAAGRCELAHPAYNQSCPEWVKWDRIARSSVAYC